MEFHFTFSLSRFTAPARYFFTSTVPSLYLPLLYTYHSSLLLYLSFSYSFLSNFTLTLSEYLLSHLSFLLYVYYSLSLRFSLALFLSITYLFISLCLSGFACVCVCGVSVQGACVVGVLVCLRSNYHAHCSLCYI